MTKLLTLMLLLLAPGAYAQVVSSSAERLKADTIQNVRTKMTTLLDKYCGGACELITVNVNTEDYIDDDAELGFESLTNSAARSQFVVRNIDVEIQVDDKVTSTNRDRMQAILLNHLRAFGLETSISWRPVRLPAVGQTSGAGEQLKAALERKVTTAVSEVINSYCPDQCVLAQVNVVGAEITPDEAVGLPRAQVFRGQESGEVIRVDDVQVAVEIDDRLSEASRERIGNLMRAKTRFVAPTNIDLSATTFPEPAVARQKRLDAQAEDPFNLDKLRHMLTMFKELAGTKEIITTNSSNNTSSNSTSDTAKVASTSSSTTANTSSTSERSRSESSTSQAGAAGQSVEWAAYIGAFILLAGLIVAIFLRVLAANRDAKIMVAGAGESAAGGAGSGLGDRFNRRTTDGVAESQVGAAAASQMTGAAVSQRLKIEALRADLLRLIVESPKVARDTFARMLREDGVELTAKYVHILGQVVVFELIDDPALRDNLVNLSEYYHRCEFNFSPDEEQKLLQNLKTRLTASEIRVLTRKSGENFDFLSKLTPSQIFDLIAGERAQVQSVVLAQLERATRMAVFERFTGQAKANVLQALSKSESLPREYLNSVAQAMQRKIQEHPEFDAESTGSSDILLDFMQRADLQEQRQLLANISRSNPEAARGIRAKLVTAETLAFLKDGLLIEVVLGMQRSELLVFLRGAKQHIRNLLLNKAPRELAESWYEELQSLGPVDESQYRSVEARIVERIGAMAKAGAISIAAINDTVFGGVAPAESAAARSGTQVTQGLPPVPNYLAA